MKKVLLILGLLVLCSGLGFGGFMWYQISQNQCYIYDPGDYFVTNVGNSSKLVKADVVIEFENCKHKEFLSKNNFKIRDLIIFELRNKSVDEVMSPDIKEILNRDIIEKLKSEYNITAKKVYFNEFIVE